MATKFSLEYNIEQCKVKNSDQRKLKANSICLFSRQWTKLMRLEVPNQIVVIESKSLSEFDCQLLFDTDSNDVSESTISISI